MSRISSPILVIFGLAVLCAPLGYSYYLSAVFLLVAGFVLLTRRGTVAVPTHWLFACVALVGILSLNAVNALGGAAAPSEYVVQAWLAIVASLALLVVGFLLGQRTTAAFPALGVSYAVVRIIASPVLPLGPELTEMVERYYRSESYQFVGLGTRVILPGDVALIATWLWVVTSTVGKGTQRFVRLLIFVAALASFSRLLLVILVSLELLRVLILARHHIVRYARATMVAAVVIGAVVYALRDVEVPVGTSELYAARVIAETSNAPKLEQAERLAAAILRDGSVFLFGSGLGSFISGYVRDEDRPFQYEVQLLASMYQIGIIAFLLWLFAWTYPIALVGSRLWRRGLRTESLLTLATGTLFILGGAVNPVVLLPQNFVLFGIFGTLDHYAGSDRTGLANGRRATALSPSGVAPAAAN